MQTISTIEDIPTNVLDKVRFSVDDYYKMTELGLLPEDVNTEIIEGELIKIMPIGSLHSGIVDDLSNFFVYKLYGKATVRVQNPVRLDKKNEPQPDIAILKPREDAYKSGHPQSGDVLLIVEVSETTLIYDRETKIPLYATAEIPEVWLINLKRKIVEIFTRPEKGNYRDIAVIQTGEIVQSKTIPKLILEASKIFEENLVESDREN